MLQMGSHYESGEMYIAVHERKCVKICSKVDRK